jgi:16S rRNA (adenine1518-N6/adenine1519-N6)-dimethyltransferase
MTLTEIRQALESRGLRPLKQLGQNFLHDQNLARWLADEATSGLEAGSHLIEIGPGLGSLTECLLAKSVVVTALEKDRGLCRFLRERFASPDEASRFDLREGDALELLPALDFRPPLLCGNLPYYISTPLLMTCLETQPQARLFFVMQKEVGERLASGPGTKAYGALSVLIQLAYDVELKRTLPGSVFFPAPEVASIAIRLSPRSDSSLPAEDRGKFTELVQRGFSQRRKVLSNLLPTADKRRAEELSPKEWVQLWREIASA